MLAFALLVLAGHASWERGSPTTHVALGASCALAAHTHFFVLPLIGALALAAAARRRWWTSLAAILGASLAAPVLLYIVDMLGADSTYINTPALGSRSLLDLYAAWSGRFGPPWAFAALLTGTGVAAVAALRLHRTRPAALAASLTLAVAVTVLLASFATGGAAVHQTPYWLVPSWCAFALLALGMVASRGRVRIVVSILVLPWLVLAVPRALKPRSVGPGELGWAPGGTPARVTLLGEVPRPDDLARYLDEHFAADDVLVYFRFFDFDNDQPHRWDPLFTAIRPGHVGTWLPPANPCGRMGLHYRDGVLCMGNELHPGEGINPHLLEPLSLWLADGRTVRLVLADADSASSPLDRALLDGLDATVEEVVLGRNRVLVLSPSL